MSKRALVMVMVAVVLAAIVAFIFWRSSDAGKYWRLKRADQAFRHHHSDKYAAEFNALSDELFASGYLTNVSITVSNAISRREELIQRLHDSIQGTDILVCNFTLHSNQVVIMTLPKNAAIVRKALEE